MDVRRPRLLLVTGAYSPEFSAGGLQSQAVARALGDRAVVSILTTATDPALKTYDTIEGVAVTRDEARSMVYGMPYEEWKAKHQSGASDEQKAKFAQSHKH